jgi:hypothetical protein
VLPVMFMVVISPEVTMILRQFIYWNVAVAVAGQVLAYFRDGAPV